MPVKRLLLLPCLLAAVAADAKPKPARTPPAPFTVVEASIADMQKALAEHRVTSRELVLQYLVRIGTYEDKLNAAITVNPKALEEADALDRERAQKKIRGPLHGIPSRSRTTSTPRTCRPPGGASPSTATSRPTRRR
jgi:amidase